MLALLKLHQKVTFKKTVEATGYFIRNKTIDNFTSTLKDSEYTAETPKDIQLDEKSKCQMKIETLNKR